MKIPANINILMRNKSVKAVVTSIILAWALMLPFLVSSIILAAQSPCVLSTEDCKIGKEGWQLIAVQHYDVVSSVTSIWEKNGQRVICIDPGPTTCGSYGGDLERFKKIAIDAQRDVDNYNAANRSGQLSQYLKQKMERKSITNCWTSIILNTVHFSSMEK